MILLHSFLLWLFTSVCYASITVVYAPGQAPASATTNATVPTATGAVNDPTVLTAPALPSDMPSLTFPVTLQAVGQTGLSIQHLAGFMGFSIEMSVVNQVLGKNSTLLQVAFLNLMANIQQRAGRVNIRVGGNSQETAAMVDSLPDGRILAKSPPGPDAHTQTPTLIYTMDLLYTLRNVSDHVNVRWFLGVPFNVTQNFDLRIVEFGEAVLGDFLLGFQVGNEPDLYVGVTQLRTGSYTQFDYFGDFGEYIQYVNNDTNVPIKNLLMGPSISGNGNFTEQQLWDTGFVQDYTASIAYLTVERYPTNNCQRDTDSQTELPNYVTHQAGQNIVNPYIASTAFAQTQNKPYIMLETNTASCGGFAGISDAFIAALWGIDYGLQMAYANFSGAHMHVGGQQAFYNPFTPPPTNESAFHQWTVGPIYYSVLIMAEVMGPSNTTQVADMFANSDNEFTPAYAVYENGEPARVALFNYLTDPTGASTYNASVSVAGGTPLDHVTVKYLLAPSVTTKYNFTWGNQSFGGVFESDGRLQPAGDPQTTQIPCTNGVCIVPVPAPGFALVFLNDDIFGEDASAASPTTFATTALTKTANTITVNPSVLSTSNGQSGSDRAINIGSTSHGSAGNSATKRYISSVAALAALAVVAFRVVS